MRINDHVPFLSPLIEPRGGGRVESMRADAVACFMADVVHRRRPSAARSHLRSSLSTWTRS